MTDQGFDPFIQEIARELKRPVHLDARFDERVMAALEPEVIPISSRRSPLPWYRRTVSVSVSGLAVAAVFAGIVAFGAFEVFNGERSAELARGTEVELTPVANQVTDPGTQVQDVQFLVVAPSARTVALVGSFNGWDSTATPMRYDSLHGAWHATVPLIPGLYQYQFLIDGSQRLNDPTAPQVSSEFGSPNSVVTVKPREE